jgi:hypothetical protein
MRKAPKPKAPKSKPKALGRPSTYSEKTVTVICARLAAGESLSAICRDEGYPTIVTVYAWLMKHETFFKMYTRAREEQADTLADEIVAIADDGKNDTYVDDDGIERTNQDVIQRSKLRVDARKWVAAKLKPRKYGERVMGDPDNPIRVDHSGQVNLYIPDNNRTKETK